MLDLMRENARSVVTYVLFGIIIVVFAFSFGSQSKGCGVMNLRGTPYAAKVNDTTINTAEVDNLYNQMFRQAQGQFGGQLTPELAEQLGLRDRAVNQLVDAELIIQDAKRHGLEVSDEEISDTVTAEPAFQSNGRFDMDLYKKYVGSPAKYEASLRRAKLQNK